MDQQELTERIHAVETAQATQAATMAGGHATQMATQAGTWSTMMAGFGALIIGIFLGLAMANTRR